MSTIQGNWRLGLIVGLTLFLTTAARADDPKNPVPQKDTLQAVLDRIHQHAANEAWKQPGFKDDEIERWLDKLVGSISKAAEIPDLKVPVQFRDVQPSQPQPGARGIPMLTGALVVAKDVDWKSASVQASMIFADGNIDLERASNSVIIARGAITIHGLSTGCVLVAGTLVKVGEFDGRPDGAGGSIIASRGWVHLGRRSYGTIVAANEGIASGDTQDVLFINAPVPLPAAPPARGRGGFGGALVPARDTRSKTIKVPDLPLEALRIHPLGEKLKFLGVMHGDAPPTPRGAPRAAPTIADLNRGALQPTAVIFQFEDHRYFADLGQPIVDEAGAPVAALQGWKLMSLAKKLAILSGPDAVTVLRMDAK